MIEIQMRKCKIEVLWVVSWKLTKLIIIVVAGKFDLIDRHYVVPTVCKGEIIDVIWELI